MDVTSLTQSVVDFYNNFDAYHPPIVETYPWLPAPVLLAYLAIVFYGPKFIKGQGVPGLNIPLQIWNLGLAVFSVIMLATWLPPVAEFAAERGFYEAVCMPGKELWHIGPTPFVSWVFTMSKFVELGDTVFLVLRNRPVIFLHWYHHCTVLLYCWVGMIAHFPFGNWFGIVNCFIHSIMYFYYFLAARGHRPKWGKYLTQMQLAQMVFGLFITASWVVFAYTGHHCPLAEFVPAWFVVATAGTMYASYFYLFLRMYQGKHGSEEGQRRRGSAAKPVTKSD